MQASDRTPQGSLLPVDPACRAEFSPKANPRNASALIVVATNRFPASIVAGRGTPRSAARQASPTTADVRGLLRRNTA